MEGHGFGIASRQHQARALAFLRADGSEDAGVAAKAHGVVLMDRAGWHSTGNLKVPKNLTIILLPSRSPELNPVENIWQYLRQNWLSNRVFEDYHAIIEAGCQAWNKLIVSTRDDHVHRTERLGPHRSIINAVGITCKRRCEPT